MFSFLLFCRHPHHQHAEHVLDEVKELLEMLRKSNGELLMSKSLENLKAKVADQAALIAAAQTFVNTLEAANGGTSNGVSDADLDAIAADIDTNNAALQALSVAPTTGTGGDTSGASTAGTLPGVNDGTQNGTAGGTPTS